MRIYRQIPRSPALQRSDPLARGLLGYWLPGLARGDGGIVCDLTGQGRDGTVVGGVGSSGPYGPALRFDDASTSGGSGDYVLFGGSEAWLPTDAVTVTILYAKTDATNRQSGAFGIYPEATGTDSDKRLGVHLPWSDGNVYWDFGGNSSPNRLTASGLSFGLDMWSFVHGDGEAAIWQNGVKRNSSASTGTRVNESNFPWSLGNHGSQGSDLAQYWMVAMHDHRLSDAQIMALHDDPLRLVRPRSRLITYAAALGGGSPPAARRLRSHVLT